MKYGLKMAVFIFSAIMTLILCTGRASAADADHDGYDDSDFQVVKTFLNTPSAESGKSNGQQLNAAYDEAVPATWTGVEWNSDTPKRVLTLGKALVPGTASVWANKKLAGFMDLRGLAAVQEIYCYNNSLTSIDVSGLASMTTLYCDGNQLSVLNTNSLPAMKELRCFNNQLTTIDVISMPGLTDLYCYNNQLATLDVNGLNDLQNLYCHDNTLTALNVAALPALKNLHCYHNRLAALDASALSNMVSLQCQNNLLTNLQVAGLSQLQELQCYNNQLASLDVSGQAKLETLYCDGNNLTALTNANNLPALKNFNCFANQLPNLDISGSPLISSLLCYNNKLTNVCFKGSTVSAYGKGYVEVIWYGGPSVVLQAVPRINNSFISWTSSGALVSANTIYSITPPTSVTANFTIPALTGISITAPAAKLAYKVGDTLDITGLVVTGTYSDLSSNIETITAADISGFSSTSPAAIQTLTVNFGGKTALFDISIDKANGPVLAGVACDDALNAITGLTAAMELSTDGTNWKLYSPGSSNLPDLTGDVSLYVRIAETTTHYAGPTVVFAFTKAAAGGGSGSNNTVGKSGGHSSERPTVTNPSPHVLLDNKNLADSNDLLAHQRIEFVDMKEHWAKDAVEDLAARLVVNGMGNNCFYPNKPVSRAEAVVIMDRALGIEPLKRQSSFSDINASDWFSPYIEAAKEHGLISGTLQGKFKPYELLSREQAAVIMINAMWITKMQEDAKAIDTEEMSARFNDAVQISPWAVKQVAICVRMGFVNGKGAANLAPKVAITRAEMAELTRNFLKKSGLI